MLQLVDLLLCLPASSADCERGFSLAKVIKSDWRSRLRDTAVTNLMAIQLHSPDIMDFDPIPAIHRWKGKCKRRRSVCSNSDDSNSDYSDDSEMEIFLKPKYVFKFCYLYLIIRESLLKSTTYSVVDEAFL